MDADAQLHGFKLGMEALATAWDAPLTLSKDGDYKDVAAERSAQLSYAYDELYMHDGSADFAEGWDSAWVEVVNIGVCFDGDTCPRAARDTFDEVWHYINGAKKYLAAQ